MKRIAFILLSILFASSVAAQTPAYHLTGTVTDSTGAPLYPATVLYSTGKDSLETLTDSHGKYHFTRATDTAFTLYITMKGYAPYTKGYRLDRWKSTELLAPIRLARSYGDLDPIVISAIRPISTTLDTLTFHVAAFPTRAGSEVEDILKRLPGIEVDMNGNVIVQGKIISHVLVNGKEFFGGDVLLAIRNLPADVVDKLQVIDDYGDKARLTGVRTGNPDKVLNIVLRSDKRRGAFGQIDGTLGDKGKYAGGAFANAFDGERQASIRGNLANNSPFGSDPTTNAGIDFADQWNPRWLTSFDLQSNAQAPRTFSQTSSLSRYPYDSVQQSQTSLSAQRQNQSEFSGRIVYKPDANTTLRLSLGGALNHSTTQSTTQFSTAQTDSGFTKMTQGGSLVKGQTTGQSIHAELYFEKLLPGSRSRYTIQASAFSNSGNALTDNQSTATIRAADSTSPSFLHDQTTMQTPTTFTHLAATYYLPVGQSSFLDIGYQVQENVSRAHLQTQAADTSGIPLLPVDSLTQRTSLRNFSQNGHVGYNAHFQHLDATTSLDVQPGLMTGTADAKGDMLTYRYFSVFPVMQIAWTLDKTKRLSVNYAGSPSLPSLQQLSPFTNITNPQYPVFGNPHLKESYSNKIDLDFEQSVRKGFQYFGYGLVLTYSSAHHPIVSNIIMPQDNSPVIQATTYANGSSSHVFSSSYHVTLPAMFDKHFKIMLSAGLSRNRSTTMTDSVAYPNITWTWAPTAHLNYVYNDHLSTDFTGTYSSTRTVYPGTMNSPALSRTALISSETQLYFLRKWILRYVFQQPYTSDGARLITVPPSLTINIQRQFLPGNRMTLTLAGFNLLNQPNTTSQTTTSTTTTQSTPQLTGRYFQLSLLWKLQRFPTADQHK